MLEYALTLMKDAWRNRRAPKSTGEISDFVERHVHKEFVLTVAPLVLGIDLKLHPGVPLSKVSTL